MTRLSYVLNTADIRIVKEFSREHRVGLEPTSPHYGCGVLAAGRPVQIERQVWDITTEALRH